MQESNKESNSQILKATGIIMVAMMLSRVLGYARDVIIYSKFGQNYYTDTYNAAFSVPDLIYYLLVGGALSSAFIPVISGYIAKNEKEEAVVNQKFEKELQQLLLLFDYQVLLTLAKYFYEHWNLPLIVFLKQKILQKYSN